MIALESNSGRKYNRDEVSNRRILPSSLYSKVLTILEYYSVNKYKYFQVHQEHISWNVPYEHRQKIWLRKKNEFILLNNIFIQKNNRFYLKFQNPSQCLKLILIGKNMTVFSCTFKEQWWAFTYSQRITIFESTHHTFARQVKKESTNEKKKEEIFLQILFKDCLFPVCCQWLQLFSLWTVVSFPIQLFLIEV
jgi:hypothetical protein